MKLTELRYLVALSIEQHFGRAAKKCFVSQPTLSVAVNKLEQSLGVSLFERFHHDVRITDVGREVVAQAVRALEEIDKIKHVAKQNMSQLTGPISIGAIFTVAPYILPRIIPQLQQEAPDMPLILKEAYTEDLRGQLIRGELDVALIAYPFKEKGIVTRAVYKESFVCVIPKSHRLSQVESVDQGDLVEENILLLGDGHCLRSQVLNVCPVCEPKEPLAQSVEGTSIETLKQMVATGLGITILPTSSIQSHVNGDLVAIKPFKGQAYEREIALAWRVSFPRPKAIDVIINALKEAKIDGVKPCIDD